MNYELESCNDDALAGRQIRFADAGEESRVHGHRFGHPGGRHRGQHDHVQRIDHAEHDRVGPDADRLVRCEFDKLGLVLYQGYRELRDNNPVFSDLIANGYGMRTATLVRNGSARHVDPLYVSANYFTALGAAPLHGRTFLPEEELAGAEPVAVLSYRTWQRLGAEPEMVGQYVRINGALCRIIGVTQKTFTGAAVVVPDLWLPLGTYGRVFKCFFERGEGRSDEVWHYPPLALCTDNGAMIAMAAALRLHSGLADLSHGGAFDVRPRWPLGDH